MTSKEQQISKNSQGKAGKTAGKWTSTGFQPAKQTKKPITLLDILLGRK